MDNYRDIITQDDIDAMSNAIMCNHALGSEGVAMQSDVTKTVDGEVVIIRVYFDICGEDQYYNSIYTTDRIICADRID